MSSAAQRLVLGSAGCEIDRSYFWTEGCAAFALHLARKLHAEGVVAHIAVLAKRDGELFSEERDFEFTHVVVSIAEGYIDVNGFERDPAALFAKIDCGDDFNLQGDWDVDYFEQTFVGFDDDKPLYPGDAEITDQIERLLAADPSSFSPPHPRHRDKRG